MRQSLNARHFSVLRYGRNGGHFAKCLRVDINEKSIFSLNYFKVFTAYSISKCAAIFSIWLAAFFIISSMSSAGSDFLAGVHSGIFVMFDELNSLDSA